MSAAVALVTGGTRGLGRSLALALARAGVPVVALYRGDEGAAGALRALASAEKLPLSTLRLDLADAAAVSGLRADLVARGSLGWVIHSASRDFEVAPFTAWTTQTLSDLWETNARGAFLLFQALFPLLKRSSSQASGTAGRPVIAAVLSSVVDASGEVVPKGFSGYIMAKSALEGLMRALAAEWAKNGIRVVSAYPPVMSTGVYLGWPEVVQQMVSGNRAPADPDTVAARIVEAILQPESIEIGKVRELHF